MKVGVKTGTLPENRSKNKRIIWLLLGIILYLIILGWLVMIQISNKIIIGYLSVALALNTINVIDRKMLLVAIAISGVLSIINLMN